MSENEALLIELRDRLFLAAIAYVREYPNVCLMNAADREIKRLLNQIEQIEGSLEHDI